MMQLPYASAQYNHQTYGHSSTNNNKENRKKITQWITPGLKIISLEKWNKQQKDTEKDDTNNTKESWIKL